MMEIRDTNGSVILLRVALACPLALAASSSVFAQANTKPAQIEARANAEDDEGKEEESPWLFLPTFSLNPKLGASFGVMGAYLHHFDDESRVSMFGLGAQYTTTDSVIGTLFGRASWDKDRQRAIGMLAAGNIKNDYDDYLGTGVPLKTDDDLHALVGRYLYRVQGDWFVGVQGAYTNYQVLGESAFDDQILDLLGLQGFKSAGLGLSVYHDSRDNENTPTKGFLLNANNIAYREWLAGDNNFDVYRVDLRDFIPNGDGNVLAVRQFNQFTSNAPAGAFAPVQLRGYKLGQYLAEYMSSLEAEERFRWSEKWTNTVFVGAAVLYGDDPTGSSADDVFPMVGAGVQYALKPKEGIVVNLEAAVGKDDNYGVYIKLGYGF